MPLITPSAVNSMAYMVPLSEELILDEVILAAEAKYIVPIITQTLYDDLHDDTKISFYAELINYIRPCLAYYVKLTIYNQVITEMDKVMIPESQRLSVLADIKAIAETKKNLLLQHLATGVYPLYVVPSSRRIAGFRIT